MKNQQLQTPGMRLLPGDRRGILPVVLLRLLLMIIPILSVIKLQAQGQEKEANLKAAFIYNFTKYVSWDSSFNVDEFVIGVIGPSAITGPLTDIASRNTVDDKKIVIRQFNKPEDIVFCHILFIPSKLPFPLHSILERLEKGTLTISEEDGFARQGTAFNFFIKNDKLKFESNLNAINAAGLKAGSQLLKLATLVE